MQDVTTPIATMAGEAADLLAGAAAEIAPASWDSPSNLDGWSLRELVAHGTGSAAKIVALAEGGPIRQQPSQPADWICKDPVQRLRELAERIRDVLPDADMEAVRPSPAGEVALRQALAFPVADLAMHSWDIHRSLGRLIELPEDLLALCRGLVESLPEESLRRPGAFGPAQVAPADATPTASLMAYLGRRLA
ncbi:TIGR03086 family protein [Mycolicibacterium sp. CH28]|uniref:TIGR03086 family metal-binding protein n=1 Tax=Mycolicibacterium sp. CH28 TaxID=2512237 RepID=UPI001080DF43|nr:TIGR03086 family metal-binding protein [Mycolicibacterium sp. CH28]TGD88901.1 TIGR03086 family protein [Mycolicibacterium sp. CH28]